VPFLTAPVPLEPGTGDPLSTFTHTALTRDDWRQGLLAANSPAILRSNFRKRRCGFLGKNQLSIAGRAGHLLEWELHA